MASVNKVILIGNLGRDPVRLCMTAGLFEIGGREIAAGDVETWKGLLDGAQKAPGPAPNVEEQIIRGEVEGGKGRSLDGIAPPGRGAPFITPGAPIEPSLSGCLGAVHRAVSSRTPRPSSHPVPSPHRDRVRHLAGLAADAADPNSGPR